MYTILLTQKFKQNMTQDQTVDAEATLSQKDATELLELFAEIAKNGIFNVYDCKNFSKSQLVKLFTTTTKKELSDLEKQLQKFVINTKAHRIDEDLDINIKDFSTVIRKHPEDYSLLENWIPKLYKQ